MNEEKTGIASTIVEFSRLLYERKYVSSKNGNVSARAGDGSVLITPSASCAGFLHSDDIVEVDFDGGRLAGGHDPSLELPFHLAVYRNRSDAKAVVHAHPPYLTAFSLVGRTPADDILPEFVVSVGTVTLIPYAMPGSRMLASLVGRAVKDANALVLSNHGAITVGRDVREAYMRMEDLEHTARVQSLAERMGYVMRIPEEERASLKRFADGGEGD